MPWYHAVIEAQHDLQNPTSREKIELLGERMRLGPDAQVLDLASGRSGPALVLAERFGCRLTCVERAAEFHDAARQRVAAAAVTSLIELVHADARDFEIERERYDAVTCLGASFVWSGLAPTLAALTPGARPGGFVAVGEPYWHTLSLPREFTPREGEDFGTLEDVVNAFAAAGLEPTTVIASSLDDWDQYETLHWLAAAEWLQANADDPDAADIRARIEADRRHYLRWQRDLLGWAIVVGRKPR